MKKFLSILLVCALLLTFGLFALGSSSDDGDEKVTQPSGTVSDENDGKEEQTTDAEQPDNALGDYIVEIKSCRLAKDYEKKPVVIVTYGFTNQKDDSPAAFYTAIEDNVYQNGVGLNEAFVLDDTAGYSSDNSTKEIKKGASIDVEVAYVLNDETTPIDVEVKEYFSFSDKVITKQFALQ